jgi:hypothetical protein
MVTSSWTGQSSGGTFAWEARVRGRCRWSWDILGGRKALAAAAKGQRHPRPRRPSTQRGFIHVQVLRDFRVAAASACVHNESYL